MKKLLGVLAVSSMLIPSLAFASVGITLDGGSVRVQAGTPYFEPGYSALSTDDGDVTNLVIASAVNTNILGDTTRSYDVTDSVLSTASAFRNITVYASGGTMLWCSNEMAPGWTVGLPNGGCPPKPAPVYLPTATVREANGSYTFGIVR